MKELAACQVVTLPPATSGTDGGPVATRETIAHEASSQLRLYRDAAGCESIQTINRQFRPVAVTTAQGSEPRVLEEQYDIRRCRETDGVSSEAIVTAWLPDTGQTRPLFRIRGRAVSGAPAGNLYQMVTFGCCGSIPLGFAASGFHFVRAGTPIEDSIAVIRNPDQEPITPRVDLQAPGSSRRLRLDFAVAGDSLSLGDARVPAGITLSSDQGR